MALGRPRTPVFGTALPPKGLAGAIRRLGYRFPDERASHWLLLLAGDRVEFWSKRLRPFFLVGVPTAALGFAFWRRVTSRWVFLASR